MQVAPVLDVKSAEFSSVKEAHDHAVRALVLAGVSEFAARKGIEAIENLQTSMRGGMIFDATTGERLDNLGDRGVRLSHMDCEDENEFMNFLIKKGAVKNSTGGTKVREALILASKAAFPAGYVAEWCQSDDPNYLTGYVAHGKFYERLFPVKLPGSAVGGRVFFLRSGTDVESVINFYENQPLLVEVR